MIHVSLILPNTDPNPKSKNNIAVKDDTETKLHIVLYLKVIFLGMGWVYKRPITPQSRDY